jgi:hypothetical protein
VFYPINDDDFKFEWISCFEANIMCSASVVMFIELHDFIFILQEQEQNFLKIVL